MATASSSLYGNRLKKINSIHDIKKAMHILWWRPVIVGGYYHHAIVSDVDYEKNLVSLIHCTAENENQHAALSSAAAITEQTLPWSQMEVQHLYYLHYETCLSDDDVINNARQLVGHHLRYHVLLNNCETFASRCKTGDGLSIQGLVGRAVTVSVTPSECSIM